MIPDAFADVDPYLPPIAVVLEPAYTNNFLGRRPDPGQTAKWGAELAKFPWLDLILDEEWIGPEVMRFLKGEITMGHIPRDKVYLVAPDDEALKAAWLMDVKGAIIPGYNHSSGDLLRNARGHLQRVQTAQELLARKYGTYRLDGRDHIPVLIHQQVDDGRGLEVLVKLQKEGLLDGCIDATPEGTLVDAYSPERHSDLTLLRNGEKTQAWMAWNQGACPIVRISDVKDLLDYARLEDLRWRLMKDELSVA